METVREWWRTIKPLTVGGVRRIGKADGRVRKVSVVARGFLRLHETKSGTVQLNAFIAGTIPPETFLSAALPTPVLAIPQTSEPAKIVDASAPSDASPDASPAPPPEQPKGGCAGCAIAGDEKSVVFLGAFVALAFALRKKRK